MSLKLLDSAALYEACASTEPDVQAQAYEQLWTYLYRVAFQLMHDQPNADDLSQDCAQSALIRIHERLHECEGPTAFLGWGKRIVSNMAIDELRRRKRLLPSDPEDLEYAASNHPLNTLSSLEAETLTGITIDGLRDLIEKAPISKRSRRVILGRFFDNDPDEELSRQESKIAGQVVLPSHIQVTRTKDFNRLRDWELIVSFLSQKG